MLRFWEVVRCPCHASPILVHFCAHKFSSLSFQSEILLSATIQSLYLQYVAICSNSISSFSVCSIWMFHHSPDWMTSKTFSLNTSRLNIVGRPKTFNLNILKAYVKLMCRSGPDWTYSRRVHAGKRVSMVQFRFTSKNVSEASVTLPSGCGGMEGIKVLMTVLLCHRQHKLWQKGELKLKTRMTTSGH